MTPVVLEAPTLGEAWLLAARTILGRGGRASYDEQTTRELGLLTLVVERPAAADPIISELGDPSWLDWMRDNFASRKKVPELGGAQSYGSRLFDYARAGRDQIAWVVERLRVDPASRSATITTFEPLTDTTYVPCVSMLDFWLPAGMLELVVYAHSLDFGKKAYGNLVELALLQEHVASELEAPPGQLIVHVKSAHVYEPEWALMARLTTQGVSA
jgi:thymidylate synthase